MSTDLQVVEGPAAPSAKLTALSHLESTPPPGSKRESQWTEIDGSFSSTGAPTTNSSSSGGSANPGQDLDGYGDAIMVRGGASNNSNNQNEVDKERRKDSSGGGGGENGSQVEPPSGALGALKISSSPPARQGERSEGRDAEGPPPGEPRKSFVDNSLSTTEAAADETGVEAAPTENSSSRPVRTGGTAATSSQSAAPGSVQAQQLQLQHQQTELTVLVARWRIPSAEVFLDPSNMLGRGNYGAVFAGRCRGSDVAVKRLNAGTASKPGAEFDVRLLRSLLAEADVMSKAQNPHVLLMLGVVVEPGNVALVTELMPNGSVEDLLVAVREGMSGSSSGGSAASKPGDRGVERRTFMRNPWARAHIVRDAALGLCWLNGKGIIHRDLKPQNLLIDQGWRVKVCDFGFSIQLAVRGAFSDAAPRGSPMYMAPECLRGEPFNAASDIYSLGFIAWEVMTMGTLFPSVRTEAQLKSAVCDRHERPVLGKSLDVLPAAWHARIAISNESALGRLLRATWAPSPLARCNSDTFVTKFDEAAVEYVLEKAGGPSAVRFWLTVATTSRSASGDGGSAFVWWGDFRTELEKLSGPATGTVWQALQALCEMDCTVPSLLPRPHGNSVSIQKLAELLQWFGPVDQLVSNVGRVVVGPSASKSDVCGFHARLTKDEADEMLKDPTKPAGFFVLRFSSEPGSFGLSCASDSERTGTRSVLHFRIAYNGSHYAFDGRNYNTLVDFVEAVREPFALTNPVPAAPLVPREEKKSLGGGYEDHLPPGQG